MERSAVTDRRHCYRLLRDWLKVQLTNGHDEPVDGALYVAYLSDGTRKSGNLDGQGEVLLEKLPPGDVLVEFPEFFDLAVYRGETTVWDPGRGVPPPPRPAATLGGTEEAVEPSMVSDEDDTPDDRVENLEVWSEDDDHWDDKLEEYDEEEEEEDSEWDEEFLDPEDYVSSPFVVLLSESASATTPTSPPTDDRYRVAGFPCARGNYRMALLRCVSVRLIAEDGQPYPDRISFEIRNQDGNLEAEGECRNGVIFADEVGIGGFELILDDTSYIVPSVRDAAQAVDLVLGPHPNSGEG